MSRPEEYELYAIRYAVNDARIRSQNFILDASPNEPLQIDFFSWVAIGRERTVVIDTGMNRKAAKDHGHRFLHCPTDVLRRLGVEPETTDEVVLTHLHYDHIGNIEKFPQARFHLHDTEMAFATGRYMRYPHLRRAYLASEIATVVHYVHEGRVRFHDEDREIVPGITVHWAGGHTAGQEFVRVRTRRGWVVLASDVIHYYEEIERSVPFAVVYDVGEMLEGHDAMRARADSPDHIVPGHDPLIMQRYPAASSELEGIAVRLDMEPESR